ncbi:hypothetical protein TNCV_10581 [Trichonephila clavipes]|nr:hypothetical protein TNCV_10581 [Trichonephila clavipes]
MACQPVSVFPPSLLPLKDHNGSCIPIIRKINCLHRPCRLNPQFSPGRWPGLRASPGLGHLGRRSSFLIKNAQSTVCEEQALSLFVFVLLLVLFFLDKVFTWSRYTFEEGALALEEEWCSDVCKDGGALGNAGFV